MLRQIVYILRIEISWIEYNSEAIVKPIFHTKKNLASNHSPNPSIYGWGLGFNFTFKFLTLTLVLLMHFLFSNSVEHVFLPGFSISNVLYQCITMGLFFPLTSTVRLRKTSLWRHYVSALSKFLKTYTEICKIDFLFKKS